MFFAFGGCRAAVHAPVVRVDREASLALPLRRAARSACSSAGGASPPARRVQRALGLDYGRRVVGLAVSTLGLAPRPLEGLPGVQAHEQLRLAADVLAVAQREACDAIVVGLPVTQAGSLRQRDTDSQQGRRCRNFAGNMAALAAPHAIPVFLADERGSTVEALEVLASSGAKRSLIAKRKDSVAAAVILETFFQNSPGSVMLVKPPRQRSEQPQSPRRQKQQQLQHPGHPPGVPPRLPQ